MDYGIIFYKMKILLSGTDNLKTKRPQKNNQVSALNVTGISQGLVDMR